MKMNQQQLQMVEMMEQHRRASITSESSVEVMDLARTPNQRINRAPNNDSSPSNSEHNESDSYESDTEECPSTNKPHPNSFPSSERRNSRISLNSNGGNIRKKFRSSTPNANINANNYNNNNNNLLTTNAINNSLVSNNTSNPQTDRTQNESGFVDLSSQHLNSSPEPPGAIERDDVKYICPICEVVSATPHEFTNHIRCHNYSSGDTENFTCRICSKVRSTGFNLFKKFEWFSTGLSRHAPSILAP